MNKVETGQIQRIINAFKSKDKAQIAALIAYPLHRSLPIKDIKNTKECIQRFDEVFDAAILNRVGNSKITSWSKVGWRGIMFEDGKLWMNDVGQIIAVNYEPEKEKKHLTESINADRNNLPPSLRTFLRPPYTIQTKTYRIRIDEKSENHFRYAAWRINNSKIEPDIIIENGVKKYEGSGGNHSITFQKNDVRYVVNIFLLGAEANQDAELEVTQQGKQILQEDGKIIRN